MAGHDPRDSSSLLIEKQDYTRELEGNIKPGMTIGVVENALEAPALDPEIKQAVEQALQVYQEMGATVIKLQIPALDYCAASYFIISRAEAASNLARFDGIRYGSRAQASSLRSLYEKTRHDGFGAEVQARILVGNYVLSVGHAGEFYDNAQRVRRTISKELQDALSRVDCLVMPTHATPAFKFGAFSDNKLALDLQDYFTAPINLAGVPALSIPVGFSSEQLPLGMQLIGTHLSEAFLFKIAHAYQQKTSWHKRFPKL